MLVARACAPGMPGAYLAIGIDKLASINDAFGYEAADQVIIEIGQRLDRCLRVSDVIGRVGGDRFGIVLAHCAEHSMSRPSPRRSSPRSARCRSMTAAGPGLRHRLDRQRVLPRAGQDLYEVMTRAETALAEAKRAGRDCFVPYRLSDEQRSAIASAWRWASGCSARCSEDRLCFAYQPVVDSDHRRGRLLRMPAAHDRRGRPHHRRRRVRRRRSSSSASSASSTATCSSARSRRSRPHPGICLGFNISGLTATDRAWLRGATALLQGQARRRQPPRRRDHRDGGAARHRGIGALRRARCAISAAASRSTISAPASPRCAICRRSPSTPSRSTARSCAISAQKPGQPGVPAPSGRPRQRARPADRRRMRRDAPRKRRSCAARASISCRAIISASRRSRALAVEPARCGAAEPPADAQRKRCHARRIHARGDGFGRTPVSPARRASPWRERLVLSFLRLAR